MGTPRLPSAVTLALLSCTAAAAQDPLPKAGDAFAYRVGRIIRLRENSGLFANGGVLSQDGRYLFGRLANDETNQLVAFDFQLGEVARRFGEIAEPVVGTLAFALSPGEALVAVGARSESAVTLYEAATAVPTRHLVIDAGHFGRRHCKVVGLAFSPDGGTLYATTDRGLVSAWTVATGEELWHVETHVGNDPRQPHALFIAPTPDGKLLAAAGFKGYLRVLDAFTGAEVRKLDIRGPMPLRSVQVAADGRGVVIAPTQGVFRVNFLTGDVRCVHSLGANDSITKLVMAPSGELILFGEAGEKFRALRIARLDGKRPPKLGMPTVPDILAASPSGDRVLLRDGPALAQYGLPKK